MAFTILVVEDEEPARNTLTALLNEKGYEVIGAATLAEARSALLKGDGDVVILDVRLPDGYGPNLLRETARMSNRPPIILVTAYGDIEMAVDAMKDGAHDFLTKPLQFKQLEQSIQRACEIVLMRRELAHYRQMQQQSANFVAGSSPAMKSLLAMAQRAGEMSVSVLVTGETGTGKEVLAHFIHQSGPRKSKPLYICGVGCEDRHHLHLGQPLKSRCGVDAGLAHPQQGATQGAGLVRLTGCELCRASATLAVVGFRQVGQFEIGGKCLDDLVRLIDLHPADNLQRPVLQLTVAGEIQACRPLDVTQLPVADRKTAQFLLGRKGCFPRLFSDHRPEQPAEGTHIPPQRCFAHFSSHARQLRQPYRLINHLPEQLRFRHIRSSPLCSYAVSKHILHYGSALRWVR